MNKIILLISLFFCCWQLSFSQELSTSAFDAKYLNWYNMDYKTSGILGASVDKAYSELLSGKEPKKVVIVAVIDGGVDINNEDLKGRIWVNEDEIPNDSIDNDNNGYIDDLNGWNFIGNSSGENVNYENFEYTRIVKLGPDDANYTMAKNLYDEELAKRTKDRDQIDRFEDKLTYAKKVIKDKTGIEVNGLNDLAKVQSDDKIINAAVAFLKGRYDDGFTEKWLVDYKKRNTDYLQYYLNLDFNPRAIINDKTNDISDNHYGNADIIGPLADHGTCVAGIIAAVRNNGIGVDGIASSVKIMALRVVPNGDERDKDVALAIRYAVDNGADIINMSFDKKVSPQRALVNDAIKYAEENNVLIVHAAGNYGENSDTDLNYPTTAYLDKSEASNMLNVGASTMQKGDSMACYFSNYGKNHVQIFAPGDKIVALDTNNTFSMHSGTSQACPVVTGIAATVLSYYPDLKPKELIAILLKSSTSFKKEEVVIPDLKKENKGKTKFGELSECGGIVNLYAALKMAEKYKK
jgi:subtilisin family serine protease